MTLYATSGFVVPGATATPPPLPLPPTPSPVALSDSAPVFYATAWLSRCPEPGLLARGAFSFNCSAARSGAAVGGTTTEIFVTSTPRGPHAVDVAGRCAVAAARQGFGSDATAQQVAVPAVVAVSPAFGSAGGAATLTCGLFAGGGGGVAVAQATLSLVLYPTSWPLAADAIVLPAGSVGVMNSTLFGPANVSAAAAALGVRCGGRAVPTAADVAYGRCALTAVMDVWAGVPVAPPDSPPPGQAPPPAPFSVAVTSSTLVVLRASADGAFAAGTTATVSGAACVVAAVSSDGRWVAIFTPHATTMCGPDGVSAGICGPGVLVVSTPPSLAISSLAAALACPPFCAGDLARIRAEPSASGAAVVPFNGGSAFEPALLASIAATGAPVLVAATSPAPGIVYAPSCTAFGYTDPASGACTNASEAASYVCAFGGVGACSQVS